MLPKKVYSKVLQGLKHYQKQDDEDRREYPDRMPIDWGMSLKQMIETCMRTEHMHGSRDVFEKTINDTLEYLVTKGLLVPYHGGYAFPGKELPTKQEIQRIAEETIEKLFGKTI